MPITRARPLDDHEFKLLMKQIEETTARPKVERVVFLMSYMAGLRSQEIAGLEWDRHILGASGGIATEEFVTTNPKGKLVTRQLPVVWVSSDIGKYGAERTVRMHDMLVKSLKDLRKEGLPSKFVIPSGRGGSQQDLKSRAHALTVRINRYYKLMEYDLCTSHSGRRTFITKAARRANMAGCSLVDVQALAGHKQLETTQQYIETTAQQADLVAMLY